MDDDPASLRPRVGPYGGPARVIGRNPHPILADLGGERQGELRTDSPAPAFNFRSTMNERASPHGGPAPSPHRHVLTAHEPRWCPR